MVLKNDQVSGTINAAEPESLFIERHCGKHILGRSFPMQGAPADGNSRQNQTFARGKVALRLFMTRSATSGLSPLDHQEAQTGADCHAGQGSSSDALKEHERDHDTLFAVAFHKVGMARLS